MQAGDILQCVFTEVGALHAGSALHCSKLPEAIKRGVMSSIANGKGCYAKFILVLLDM